MTFKLTTLALSAALAFAPLAAMADQAGQKDDLAPGPAAGVQPAQDMLIGNTALYVAGGVVAVALVAVAVSGGGGSGGSKTSVPTTSTLR